MSFLNRVFRAGVDAGAPQDAKYTVLINALLVLTVPFGIGLAIAIRWAHAVPIPILLLIFGTSTVGYLIVPAINAARRYDAARIVAAATPTGVCAAACLVIGTAGLGHLFFSITIIGSWYALPPNRRLMAWMITVANLGAFVAIHFWFQHRSPPYPVLPSRLFAMQTINLLTMLSMMLMFGVYAHFTLAAASASLEREQRRSEQLLRNVLPDRIAERLKDGPVAIADRFDKVTVVFADIVGFTSLATTLAPERVVEMLNQVFTRFDELAARHRVEKIKTIGDAYMVVAGLPEPRSDHAEAAAEMALDLRASIGEVGRAIGQPLQVRIGLCSGPAVAGVIGIQKFAYDLWGDTVNTAARMESHGMPGEIHVTESAYEVLVDRYDFRDRGVIEVKGKGPMRTYFLDGKRNNQAIGAPIRARS